MTLEGVGKRFGTATAVDAIDLDIHSGEFLALMGPSGCGKTTTLRMLAGLETPSSGRIALDGRDLADVPASDRDTPLVWQSLALFPFLDVRHNVEFGLKMRGVAAQERQMRAMHWLERLGIAEFASRDVSQLSGGQRQRVALARALVTEPRILLLDEPLSALDAHLVVRMQAVLTNLQRDLGITFVYVTHSQSEAFAMADRVVIMDLGRIAQVGAPRDIYRTPATRFVAEFLGSNNIFDGTVRSVEGEGAAVETAAGTFSVLQSGQHLTSGDAVTFVVSADRVTVAAQRPATDNALQARFISEEFVGAVVTLFFEAPDGTELRVQVQQRDLDSIAPASGDDAWLGWDSAHAHLLEANNP